MANLFNIAEPAYSADLESSDNIKRHAACDECRMPINAVITGLVLTILRKAQIEVLRRAGRMCEMRQTEVGMPLLGAEADGKTSKAPESGRRFSHSEQVNIESSKTYTASTRDCAGPKFHDGHY